MKWTSIQVWTPPPKCWPKGEFNYYTRLQCHTNIVVSQPPEAIFILIDFWLDLSWLLIWLYMSCNHMSWHHMPCEVICPDFIGHDAIETKSRDWAYMAKCCTWIITFPSRSEAKYIGNTNQIQCTTWLSSIKGNKRRG